MCQDRKKVPFKFISSVSFCFFNVAITKSYMVLLLSDSTTLDHQLFLSLKENGPTSCAPNFSYLMNYIIFPI